MAIKIYEKFAPRANPADGDYPYGSIKNESVPGAKDGTPLDAVWANDYAGTDAELFAQAGIVPNGSPDKLGASQRVDAIRAMFINVGTVAEIDSGRFKVGSIVSVKDRDNGLFLIQSGGTVNGSWILNAGNGNTAILQDAGINSLMNFGSSADRATFQSAVNFGSVIVKKGVSANIIGEINIPANRRIVTEDGSTITSNGRFTAYDVNNVHWEIHGKVLSVAMTIAPAKSGWPNVTEGTQSGDERGFIEFGGKVFRGNDGRNYSVYIGTTGVVGGDWVGTPNFDDIHRQLNRKGIAAWNCSDVSFISDGEIYGFEGEAVYWYTGDVSAKNVYMRCADVHDCRFNGVNVNAALAHENIMIERTTTRNCFQGIESSAGDVINCIDYSSLEKAIYAGQGRGGKNRLISGNKSYDCGGTPFSIVYNKDFEAAGRVSNVSVTNNHAYDPANGFIAAKDIDGLAIQGNSCQGMLAGRFLQVTGCNNGIVSNNQNITPAGGTTHIYRAENTSVAFSNNPRNFTGNDYTELDSSNSDFIGGRTPTAGTNGNRENYEEMYCPPDGIGVGGEYRFSYGATLPFVAATLSSSLDDFDANGATGSFYINTLKLNTGGVLGNSLRVNKNGHTTPSTNGTQNIGSAALPFNQVFAAVGTIQPSDINLKTEVSKIPDEVLDAWGSVNYCQFKYISDVDSKGHDARLHTGMIAQEIRDAFIAKGLDATNYGLLCYDEWDEQPELLNKNGDVIAPSTSSGKKWGIRPDECAFMEAAYMRRELKRLREKLTL